MSKRILAFAAIAVLVLASVSAADFASYGFKQTGTRNIDGLDYLVLVDDTGSELLFSQIAEPGADRLAAMKSIVSMLHTWKGLTIASLRASNDSSQLRVTALPAGLMSGSTDLRSALPGGLVFYYEKAIDYDFRVLSGAYAIRMTGLFTSTADLLDSLGLAYKDPVTWLLRSDPEYAVKRITEMTIRIDGLEAVMKGDAADLSATKADLSGKIAATNDELIATKDKLAATQADLAALVAAKAESDKATASSIDRLETALMASLNVGFLSGPKPLPQAVVDWVVAKKKADPGITKAALVAAAKAEKFQASEKEIGIVLLVKFGER